jgi:hypothetical protein
MSTGVHLGLRFDVWNGQGTWFWLVVPRGGAGIVGAAANEADAVRDARTSIEELSGRRQAVKGHANLSSKWLN